MSRDKPTTSYLSAAEDLRRNDRQWKAYESRGHCVVLAGPGSGKTKVLTTKMARMLAEDVRTPRGIACITYNNQCVKELKKRLGKLGIEEGSRVFIGTVHSFCLREVLMPYAKLAGFRLPDPLNVALPSEQERLFGNAVNTIFGDEDPKRMRAPFNEFRRTVLDRSSREWTENDRYVPLIMKYEQLLMDAGKIDFDGMALFGLELIKSHTWVRKVLKAKYPILVVDEYQDLGIPLHEIVLHLCIDGGIRLLAVGDPDQSIYGFAGARPSYMNDLSNRDDIEDIRLRLNYRCGKRIILASTTALAESRDFESVDDNKGVVLDYECNEGFEEQVSFAVNTIVPEAMNRRKDRKIGDIGILYLNQYDGTTISRAVEAAGLEYVRFDQGNPYKRTLLISLLEECASWCAGGWSLGEPRLSILLSSWMRLNPSLIKYSEISNCRRSLVNFLFGSRCPNTPLLEWLATFAKQGLYANIKSDPTMVEEVEAMRILYEACKVGKPLAQYTVANFGGQRGSPDRLNLTTIHSAKGLEYDVVIMMGLEQGRIPDFRALEIQSRLQEERRKFYVAMTRARHEVHLLWSGWYESFGNTYQNGQSQFVAEVMQEMANAV